LQAKYSGRLNYADFFAIFSIGMVVAWQILAVQKSAKWLRYLGILCGLGYIGLILLFVRHSLQSNPLIHLLGEIVSRNPWISDYLLIGFVACMIVRFHSAEEWNSTVGVLSNRWLNHIGHFSYSIYLIHDPILRLMYLVQAHAGWSFPLRFCWMLGLGPVVSVAGGYLCYLLVERHFISTRP
jgi:peptidoglycan/LPS O-acetylase OafA/YrhL